MEWNWNYVILSAILTLISLVWHLRRKNSYKQSKLPPGPRGWPIFGNLFDVGNFPHRSLARLKQEYGPVVWLSFGSVNILALLSAGPVEELFKNHDLTFCDRKSNDALRSHDYINSTLIFSPFNAYLRTLRRLCTSELFANKRINETTLIRQKSVDTMLSWIEQEIEKSATGGILIRDFVFPTLYNIIGNLMLSRDLVDPHSLIPFEFCTVLSGMLECIGRPNISDYLPWLRRLDLQGIRRNMDGYLEKAIEIMSAYVKERVKQRQQNNTLPSEQRMDFLDVLLDFKGTGNDELASLSEYQVTILLLDMFMAGVGATSNATEWAMCELLQNPEEMKKIKAELGRVVGANNKMQENDINNLPYLEAIIEETLRMHTPTPILFPKRAVRDTNFMGFSIPKDTQVMINNWMISRDEDKWQDPLSFKPERFLDLDINHKGRNYEFLPFGAGRRICPGVPLADRMLPLILGSLLHHFEWELCDGKKIIDMRETLGASAKKLEPLQAIPKRKTK
ncbi:Cytochrome P450, family 76, subfamily C, polypeptide 6 [Heracleum sosnowskyi]|uniref:Cytochrome P450, family 76, subfamily C, polypeptide 6 n=1 Tax=Heracleum sosnowskyi TaxID=360622 RepID=A0AAD8I5U6_9APIA|nr:Cytochrome P450, family 76, subfamily C, polypeptide 6 [Heracleum sosnowskyi]